jgi:hypothetical protein
MTNEQLMKACQIGCNNLNDANNLLAECYGRIGKLASENERLRENAKIISELEQLARMVGHRDLKSLMTYYNETAESMARLL